MLCVIIYEVQSRIKTPPDRYRSWDSVALCRTEDIPRAKVETYLRNIKVADGNPNSQKAITMKIYVITNPLGTIICARTSLDNAVDAAQMLTRLDLTLNPNDLDYDWSPINPDQKVFHLLKGFATRKAPHSPSGYTVYVVELDN